MRNPASVPALMVQNPFRVVVDNCRYSCRVRAYRRCDYKQFGTGRVWSL